MDYSPRLPLAAAGHDALAKIAAVLPDELRRVIEAATLLVGPIRWTLGC